MVVGYIDQATNEMKYWNYSNEFNNLEQFLFNKGLSPNVQKEMFSFYGSNLVPNALFYEYHNIPNPYATEVVEDVEDEIEDEVATQEETAKVIPDELKDYDKEQDYTAIAKDMGVVIKE